MKDKNDVLDQIQKDLDALTKPTGKGLEENIEIRNDREVDASPGDVGFNEGDDERFDGLLIDADISSPADVAGVLDQIHESLTKINKEVGRIEAEEE